MNEEQKIEARRQHSERVASVNKEMRRRYAKAAEEEQLMRELEQEEQDNASTETE